MGQLSKPTYKLTLEYDGSRFSGWQTQDNARTVQGELQIAANACFGGEVDVQGAGRTDAGVHALGQVAHIKVQEQARRKLPPAQLMHVPVLQTLSVPQEVPSGALTSSRHWGAPVPQTIAPFLQG